MKLEWLEETFSIAKITGAGEIPWSAPFLFVGKTDAELSLVCPETDMPENMHAKSSGWRAFRVGEAMDFGLTGILAGLSGALADAGIALFAVSTYDTDYILVKKEDVLDAGRALTAAGWRFE